MGVVGASRGGCGAVGPRECGAHLGGLDAGRAVAVLGVAAKDAVGGRGGREGGDREAEHACAVTLTGGRRKGRHGKVDRDLLLIRFRHSQ